MNLQEVIQGIKPVREADKKAAWAHWDSLCKPLRGLGRLEEMVVQIAAIQGTVSPRIDRRAVVVMGADNGVVAEGISQTDSSVTLQVLENMGDKKSSVCIMSSVIGADVYPINIGCNADGRHPAIRNVAVRHGTGNIRIEPAMTREEAVQAVETGIQIVSELKEAGYQMIMTGEMGIGNTTTSAACAAVLFHADAELVTGRGAGLTTEGLQKKIQVVKDAIACNQPNPADGIDVIAKVGGLDIAGMTGCYLGAAFHHMPVLVDGIISAISAYLAMLICPAARDYMLGSHATAEPAGQLVMKGLQMQPILYADMHLGEGTGAAAIVPLLDQALKVYYHMPSFAEGNVEQYEHLS